MQEVAKMRRWYMIESGSGLEHSVITDGVDVLHIASKVEDTDNIYKVAEISEQVHHNSNEGNLKYYGYIFPMKALGEYISYIDDLVYELSENPDTRVKVMKDIEDDNGYKIAFYKTTEFVEGACRFRTRHIRPIYIEEIHNQSGLNDLFNEEKVFLVHTIDEPYVKCARLKKYLKENYF